MRLSISLYHQSYDEESYTSVAESVEWMTRQVKQRVMEKPLSGLRFGLIFLGATTVIGTISYVVLSPSAERSVVGVVLFCLLGALLVVVGSWLRFLMEQVLWTLDVMALWRVAGRLRRKWANLLQKTIKNRRALKLVLRLITTYCSAEAAGIESHYVTTNFEGYGDLVANLIDEGAGLALADDEVLYFITLLALPPMQWFNYNRVSALQISAIEQAGIESSDTFTCAKDVREAFKQRHGAFPPFAFLGTSPRWESYIKSVEGFVQDAPSRGSASRSRRRKKAPRIQMLRFILTTGAKHKGLLFYPEAAEQLSAWIACENPERAPRALSKDRIQLILQDIGEEMDLMRLFYGGLHDEELSYLILPSSVEAEILSRSNTSSCLPNPVEWRRLGDAFAETYHNVDNNAFIAKLPENHVQTYMDLPGARVPPKPVPVDFFLLAIGPRGGVAVEKVPDIGNWLFCVSAMDVDEKLDKLRLHFMTDRCVGGLYKMEHVSEFVIQSLVGDRGTMTILSMLEERGLL